MVLVILYILPAFINTGLFADTDKRLAVLDFTSHNVPPSYAVIIRNSLEVSLYKHQYFEMLEREKIDLVFKELDVREKCEKTSCIVTVGKTLSADYAVTGSISKSDDYNITARVVYIPEGTILFAYSKYFNSENQVDGVIKNLSEDIVRDIKQYNNNNNNELLKQAHDQTHYQTHVSLKINYLYPRNKFYEIVDPGYGVSLIYGFSNIIVQDSLIELESGYYRFKGKKNDSDMAHIFPIMLNAGYHIYPGDTFYLLPELSLGAASILLQHGEGNGFEMDENSSRFSLEPIFGISFIAGFIFTNYNLTLGISYNSIYESDNFINFINLNTGLTFFL